MSAAAAVKPPPSPKAAPATDLERLHADRAGLTGKLVRLKASSARLREAANAEAAVLREIDDLTRADAAAMTAWAAGCCVGDVPVPDQKQRRALAEKLTTAKAAAAAAVGAGHDIDHQISLINQQIAGVSQSIDKAALDIMQAEFGHFREQYAAAMALGGKLAAKIHGLCSFFANEGRRLTDRGEHEAGKRFLAQAEAMTAIRIAKPDVSHGEIIEAADNWSRRLAALRKGALS
jgi:hypothetical protein